MPESSSQSNALEVTVTELSGKLKRTVEDTFGHVRVRGEISGFRGPHSSGHCYFSLKDERARLEAVIWRGQAAKLQHMPEEGLEVIASGKLTTYPGSSKYQIVIDNLEPAGAGALMALLEERRKKLAAEGLFEDGRKQLLPYMPKVIGVVTSPTGAVIRDILHRLNDRFPIHVLVWPVRVQGETSGREVANGVYQLNNLPEDGPLPRPDVIIIARGGGSLEDLWGFNDEALVRATAGSMIPVISAVGHETDWTLVDHAADWRAPTPTAAAEKAVPVKAELEAYIADLGARLRGSMSRLNEKRGTSLRSAERGLKTPDMLLAMPRRQFDEAAGRLGRGLVQGVKLAQGRYQQSSQRLSSRSLDRLLQMGRDRLTTLAGNNRRAQSDLLRYRRERFTKQAVQIKLQPLENQLILARKSYERIKPALALRANALQTSRRERLQRSDRLLKSLSYQGVLARGYAVIRDADGAPMMSPKSVKPGTAFGVEMGLGSFTAVANSKPNKSTLAKPNGGNAVKTAAKKQNAKPGPPDNQGDLF